MKRLFLNPLLFWFSTLNLLAQAPAWQYIPGPNGGSIENFDTDGSALYALTHTGIYRSDDEGYQWQLLPHSLNTTRDKHQLRVENGVFYALNSAGALNRSDDQGASWKAILQKPFPFDFETERLQRLFVKGDTLLVGSFFGIYRSTDRGQSWKPVAELVPAYFVSIFEFKNELFAAQDRYIYRSSDRGITWDSVFANAVGHAAVLATDSFLLAFYARKNRLVRSTDGLRTWDAIDTDTLAKHLEEDPYGANSDKWVGGTNKMLYYFQRGNVHYYCPLRFCYSSDGGTTWHRGNNGGQAPVGRKLNDGIAFGNHTMLACDQIQHSLDSCKTFFVAEEGLKSASHKQLIHQGASVFSNTNWAQGHRSISSGENWTTYPTLDHWEKSCGSFIQFFQTEERLFRFRSDRYTLETSYSEDEGLHWNVLETGYENVMTATNHVFWWVERIWSQSKLTHRLWRFADGDTAIISNQVLDFVPNDVSYIRLIGLKDRLGIEAGKEFYIMDENGGFVHQLPSTSCPLPLFIPPRSLYFDGNTYYIFCGDQTYVLASSANDWQEIYPQDWTTGVPFYHHRMTFFASQNGIWWAGLEGKGLFYATDNTGRFYPVQPQMPYPYPTAISFDEDKVWVGTEGGGIWTYPLPRTESEPSEKPVFRLFPNPSEGMLNLQSDVFFKEEVSLAVFDAAGRTLQEKLLAPAQYWNLDFSGLPKGLYFLQLRTKSGVFGLKWVVG